ncbi:tyrosinase-like [Pleurodeles waltl]|uniref:tyrosinase-like n=1 Tax=Pleurodeles waltl TaxID=8319 RepID=UPI0037094216
MQHRITALVCGSGHCQIVCDQSNTHSFCQHDPEPEEREFLTRGITTTKTWPSEQDVEECVSNWDVYDRPPFDESSNECFRGCLEGFVNPTTGEAEGLHMHNLVHVSTGGAMNYLTQASNDPLFYCHHAQTDRIFAMWQWVQCKEPDDYPVNDVPLCMGLNDGLYPTMPPRTLKDCMKMPWELGYSYSDFSSWPPQQCGSPAAPDPTTTTTEATPADEEEFFFSWLWN